jgi:hypothetical protein
MADYMWSGEKPDGTPVSGTLAAEPAELAAIVRARFDDGWHDLTVTHRGFTAASIRERIVRWDEVRPGDLVLWEGTLREVEKRMLHTRRPDIMATFRLSGVGMWQSVRLDDLTAVRRHMEGE